MGSSGEFGPDTDSIRAWLDKREGYARGARVAGGPSAPSPEARSDERESAPARRKRLQGSGPDSTTAGRDVLDALGVEPPIARSRIERTGTPDSTDVGRSVVDALRADTRRAPRVRRAATPPTAPSTPTASSTPSTRPADTPAAGESTDEVAAPDPVRPPPPPRIPAAPEVRHGRWTEPEENLNALNASTDADFPERGGARRALSVVLLVVLAGTAAASYLAAREPTTATVGVAGTLGFLVLVVWAVRAGCTTTKLTIHRGQLSVRRGGRTEVVDIASHYTPVAIVGEPGQRHWTVLVEREGLPLVVINRSMVDPYWFTTVLYRLRPELRPDPAAYAAE